MVGLAAVQLPTGVSDLLLVQRIWHVLPRLDESNAYTLRLPLLYTYTYSIQYYFDNRYHHE